ncbi:MAG: hypothetical protein ACRDOL_31525 [Streptosporangiaceae bacterium]
MLRIFSALCALMTLALLLDAACPSAAANSVGPGRQPPSQATVTVTSYRPSGSPCLARLIRFRHSWDIPPDDPSLARLLADVHGTKA